MKKFKDASHKTQEESHKTQVTRHKMAGGSGMAGCGATGGVAGCGAAGGGVMGLVDKVDWGDTVD